MYINKVSVKINCYKGFSYEDTLDGIRNAGFKYIELSTSNGNSLNLKQNPTSEELNQLKTDLDSRGLTPISVGGASFLMDEDISRVIANIELAHRLNAKYVVETVFNPRNDKDSFESEEEIAKHINVYIPYLEKYDLDLVIELHGNYSTGDEISKILKHIHSNHVHINYDTGNAMYWGKLSVNEMYEDFKRNINNISYMHIKDKLDAIDVWNFPAIGSGYVPFKDIFEELKINNNNATLSVEVEFTEKGPKDVFEVNNALIESGNYLKSLGFDLY